MRRETHKCVQCGDPELCNVCTIKYATVEEVICDNCGYDAEYNLDGEDLCEYCVEDILNEMFNDLTLTEKANALNIRLKEVNE